MAAVGTRSLAPGSECGAGGREMLACDIGKQRVPDWPSQLPSQVACELQLPACFQRACVRGSA